MTLSDLQVVLGRLGIDISGKVPNSSGFIQVSCPLAPWLHKSGKDLNPGCSIQVDVTPSIFKCFACNERGKVSDLVDSYAALSGNDELSSFAAALAESDKPTLRAKLQVASKNINEWVLSPHKVKPRVLNPEILARFENALDVFESRDYLLKERKIPKYLAELFELKYDPRQGRVIFPVKGVKNQLYGFVGRTIIDDPVRYRNYLGFSSGQSLGGLNHVPKCSKTIVVEGYFDLINTYQWAKDQGYNIVCTWHADISEYQADQLAYLDSTLYFCYDNDTAGNLGWEKARKLLSASSILRRLVPPPDIDLGSMNETQFTLFMKGLL